METFFNISNSRNLNLNFNVPSSNNFHNDVSYLYNSRVRDNLNRCEDFLIQPHTPTHWFCIVTCIGDYYIDVNHSRKHVSRILKGSHPKSTIRVHRAYGKPGIFRQPEKIIESD